MNLLFLTFISLNILLENLQLTRAKPLHGWKNFGKKLFSSTNSLSGRLSLVIETTNLRPSDISVPMFSMALKMFLYVISGLHVELPFEDLINAESSSRSVPVAKL